MCIRPSPPSLGRPRYEANLESVRRGFKSDLSAAFSLEKVVSGLVLCCVALCCFVFLSLFECLSIHVQVSATLDGVL